MATMTAPPLLEEQPSGVPRTPYQPHNQEALPDYTPRVTRTTRPPQALEEREFEYKIEKKQGETRASLKVLAPAAYSKNIPTFCGTGPIKGSLNLYLKEPEIITFVVVTVRGRYLPGHIKCVEHILLFEMSDTVWPKDTHGTSTNSLPSNTKLSDTHSWPFSFKIPEKIPSFASSGASVPGTAEHYIPQTFTERILSPSIQFDMVMHVGRGKFKMDHKISCTFGYFPLTRPPPFPALKAIAYQERIPLLDPTVDLDGWIPAKKVKISGTLFGAHLVEVDCDLFLSAPLAYTRGSVIPLYLRMQSNNQYALDTLGKHKAAITVRLERKIEYCKPLSSIKNAEEYPTEKSQRSLAEAVWWPASYQESTFDTAGTREHTTCLNGEIHLRGDLAPSTTCPAFSVKYYVCLSTSDAPGFKMTEMDKTLLENPVDIVTAFAPGPRAIRQAPPGYDSERPLALEFGAAIASHNRWT